MANISEEKWIEMLEKKADGSYIAKYPKVKSKSGITFDEHLAEDATGAHLPKNVGLGNVDNVKQIPMDEKGQPNGVATLDSQGKLLNSQVGEIESFELIHDINIEEGAAEIVADINTHYRFLQIAGSGIQTTQDGYSDALLIYYNSSLSRNLIVSLPKGLMYNGNNLGKFAIDISNINGIVQSNTIALTRSSSTSEYDVSKLESNSFEYEGGNTYTGTVSTISKLLFIAGNNMAPFKSGNIKIWGSR